MPARERSCTSTQFRRALATAVAFAAPALLACSDRVTDPTSVPALAQSAASEAQSFPAELATVGWQAQGRLLVASYITVSPLVAARTYALLGLAQYGAVVRAGKLVGAGVAAERGAVAGASAQSCRSSSPLMPPRWSSASETRERARRAEGGIGNSSEEFP